MNELSDQELLRDYAERQSESAFAELVRRHIDFVYSAALRMVCDSHTAEDVTQNTFIALTKNALQVRDRSLLSSWLHSTARNFAANAIRTEVRRRAREQEAAVMNELLANEPEAVWKNIAPHLDDAIAELGDSDRDALLLRFFERKSAREMGQIFGTSEEAAQKRVSRAVERLREFFSKRGVAIGAGGLVVLISANAVQSAPLTLTASVSTVATAIGTTIHSSSAVAATKALAMTTLQKAAIATTVAVLAGAGIYQMHQASQLHDEVNVLQRQQTPLMEQIRQLQQQTNEFAQTLTSMGDENTRLKRDAAELLKLRGEVGLLRQATNELTKLEETSRPPSQPTEPRPKTDEEILQMARHKQFCAEAWMQAFKGYARNHQGQLPDTFEEAAPFWDPHTGEWTDVTPDDFEILYHGSLNAITNREVIVFREKKLWQHVGGKWGRIDILADGHSQYGSVPPGFSDTDFTDWEKERMVSQ